KKIMSNSMNMNYNSLRKYTNPQPCRRLFPRRKTTSSIRKPMRETGNLSKGILVRNDL
uniref:hypothetical protein n=1 Tax=Barnesiella intestinihominis TaxID=487174 RepID=UPI004038CCAB